MMKGERELQVVEEEPDGSIQVCSRFSPGSWGSASSTDGQSGALRCCCVPVHT